VEEEEIRKIDVLDEFDLKIGFAISDVIDKFGFLPIKEIHRRIQSFDDKRLRDTDQIWWK
jgi:hypothetical protein